VELWKWIEDLLKIREKQGQMRIYILKNIFYFTISLLIHDSPQKKYELLQEYVTIPNFLGHMSLNICLDFVLI